MTEENLAIRLRKFGRICPLRGYKKEEVRLGASVVVETDRGVEWGQIVTYRNRDIMRSLKDVRLRKIIRYANADDERKGLEQEQAEKEAIRKTQAKIAGEAIPVRLIDIELLLDGKKYFLYFRQIEGKKVTRLKDLVKDLQDILGEKTELHQLGPRDEARVIGLMGSCGRSLCCASWLEKPLHVSIKTAKGMGSNLSRTTGVCSRLMCCLKYEEESKGEGERK